jgi:hypothetical protein
MESFNKVNPKDFNISSKKLTINPFTCRTNTINAMLGRDLPQWIQLRDEELEFINTFTKNGKIIPAGTILFHGSLEYPLPISESDFSTMTFFGLDATISLWYILELLELLIFQDKDFKRYGYLYVFRINQSLPLSKIIQTIHKNPKESWRCKLTNKSICIGPQVSLRNAVWESPKESKESKESKTIYDLSTELTMHYNTYKDSMELISTYLVDPVILANNRDDLEFDPRDAIVKHIDTHLKEYDQIIDDETFIKYYKPSPSKEMMKRWGGSMNPFFEMMRSAEGGGEMNPAFKEVMAAFKKKKKMKKTKKKKKTKMKKTKKKKKKTKKKKTKKKKKKNTKKLRKKTKTLTPLGKAWVKAAELDMEKRIKNQSSIK